MEQDPSTRPSYSEMLKRQVDTETQLDASLSRLISIADDYAIFIGSDDFNNQLTDTVTDSFGSFEIGEYDSSLIIEYQANLIRDVDNNVDFTHYFLGVERKKGIHYSDLPHEIQLVAKNRYDTTQQEPLIYDGEEHSLVLDIEDAECFRVEQVDINLDSNKNFHSWSGVHFEIDGDSYEIDEEGNVVFLSEYLPTRGYKVKNDFDDDLILSVSKLEQDIAIDQIEEAMNYMATLIDRKYGNVQEST